MYRISDHSGDGFRTKKSPTAVAATKAIASTRVNCRSGLVGIYCVPVEADCKFVHESPAVNFDLYTNGTDGAIILYRFRVCTR